MFLNVYLFPIFSDSARNQFNALIFFFWDANGVGYFLLSDISGPYNEIIMQMHLYPISGHSAICLLAQSITDYFP